MLFDKCWYTHLCNWHRKNSYTLLHNYQNN